MVQYFPNWLTPNHLTIFRVFAIPVIYVLVALGSESESILVGAFLLYFLACMTDYWDGVLARKSGQTTDLGTLLDPIADKVLIAALLILFVELERAPGFLTAVIVAREFAVSGLRSIVAVKGIVIAASSGGKIKTISQMLALGFLMLHYPTLGIPCHEVGIVVLWIATAITVWTAVKYFLAYSAALKA